AKVKNGAQRDLEYKYLNDVAIGAVDLLIERLVPEGRLLLWIVTRAGEPMPEALIEEVSGNDLAMFLGLLCSVGLVTCEVELDYSVHEVYIFHELVAERAAEWMKTHPAERGGRTEVEVWKAFGEWYDRLFQTILASRELASRDAAVEMGRRGI